ncbi:cation:proton antiporter [Arundinibacter roseus]|uniref:Sodium:proton exchanger n=1 Tax=Arundinibacter roseus TaxID=2070510 RepID=A0A4R4K557_9BACT|nr:cation:proton antiporter [Arundinibacter roseus]TDB61762.1 sodium:proton exchanger [Arundinibacter roseus]
MDISILIIILSCSVLLSYGFDLISSRTKLPSVILLMATGIIIRQVTSILNITIPYVEIILPTLGTLGLILIVLEGGLDLELSGGKYKLIARTFVSAFLGLMLSMLVIASILYLLLGEKFYNAMVTATPFAIISSAVAIPSVRGLDEKRRDYMVYESSLSDILGLMLFNILVIPSGSGWESAGQFFKSTILIVIISVICCFVLLYLISRINHHVKYLPIISALFIVYAVGKIYHLSSLLAILVFGLFLNNTELFVRGKLNDFFKNDLFEKELEQFKKLTAESAFVIRTFFFLIFGYSTNISELADLDAWIVSCLILMAIIGTRYVSLKTSFKGSLNPLLYIAPRGLITVLLFLSIPPEYMVKGFRQGILMITVILTALTMMVAVMSYKKPTEQEETEEKLEVF